MGRFYGKVGYSTATEGSEGVWVDSITERTYFGDVIRRGSRWQSSDVLNDNLSIVNEISIVADPYAYQNFSSIKYVEWMGVKWKVTSISIERPRLVLTLGGEYNG